MTCREKLKKEHPTCVGDRNCGGCYGCPSEYGYLGIPEYCNHHSDTNACTKCWDREIPEEKIVNHEDIPPLSPEAKTVLDNFFSSTIKDSGDRTQFSTGAVRDMHEGKGDMASVPWEAILRLSKHYENGAKKYERWNFRKGIPVSSFIDSAVRHLAKYQCGCDDEDHLAAAAFNVLGAMLMENTMPEMQDLPLRKGKNTFDYFEKKDVN